MFYLGIKGMIMRESATMFKYPQVSEAVLARLIYFAFVLNLATKYCFLDHQNTRLGIRIMHDLDVDFLSLGSAP